MPEQQQAAQTPTPTVPTPAATPPAAPAPVTPDDDVKLKADVSGFLKAPVIEDEPADPASTGDAAGEGEAAESVTEPTEAAEDDDTAAGTADDGQPSADPEPEPEVTEPAPAPVAAAAPQPDPQIAQQAAQRAARKVQATQELAGARTKLAALKAKGDLDPYEAAPLTTDISLLTAELTEIYNAEVDDLRQREAVREQISAVDQWWTNWAKDDAVGKLVGVAKGRSVFLEEEAAAIKRFGPGERATAYATAKWEARVGQMKGHAEKKATVTPTPKPTAPAGKGKPGGAPPVVPPQTTPTRVAARPQTPEQQLAAKAGSSIRNFLD